MFQPSWLILTRVPAGRACDNKIPIRNSYLPWQPSCTTLQQQFYNKHYFPARSPQLMVWQCQLLHKPNALQHVRSSCCHQILHGHNRLYRREPTKSLHDVRGGWGGGMGAKMAPSYHYTSSDNRIWSSQRNLLVNDVYEGLSTLICCNVP